MTLGRALEALLSANLFDAREAGRYGWLNRALPADEIEDLVKHLARQIAVLPPGVIKAAKSALPAAGMEMALLENTPPGPTCSLDLQPER